jgi:hypothetical protein
MRHNQGASALQSAVRIPGLLAPVSQGQPPVRSVASIGGLFVVIAGCGTWVTETQLNPAPHPPQPRGYESVEVFSSSPPTRDHVDVALLKVDQVNEIEDGFSEIMIQHLRERAGALGCDAVFLGTPQELRGPDLLSSGSRRMFATCIVYKNPGDPVAPPPPSARRMCVDRRDFDAHRNCIMPMPP